MLNHAPMCSELVINALKYAFPSEGPGRIWVALSEGPDGIALVVEDDGRGVPDNYVPGHGGVLLDRLAALSGARITRATCQEGSGLSVSVNIESARAVVQSATNAS